MKATTHAMESLADPTTKTKVYEMTPERREKFAGVCQKLYQQLRESTEGPMEAYMILTFMMSTFEDEFGIKGGIVLEKGEDLNVQ